MLPEPALLRSLTGDVPGWRTFNAPAAIHAIAREEKLTLGLFASLTASLP